MLLPLLRRRRMLIGRPQVQHRWDLCLVTYLLVEPLQLLLLLAQFCPFRRHALRGPVLLQHHPWGCRLRLFLQRDAIRCGVWILYR